MNIKITGMSLDGHQVPVPNGLSELINAAGAWSNQKLKTNYLDHYEQKTERRNGNLVTVLTLKSS
jgi:hypothetical protein